MNLKLHAVIAAGALILSSGAACAHTVWLEAVADKPGDFKVMFGGHAGKLETYAATKIKSVDAHDASGKALKVARDTTAGGVMLHVDGKPATILMHFDNGIHTRTAAGPTVEKPMNEVPDAKSATHAEKYHKSILVWGPSAVKASKQPFEVIPVSDKAPRAGEPMQVRVMSQGKPVAGIRLGHGEEGKPTDPVTDANGVAAFIPVTGFNKLWAGQRTAVTGNPAYTELSYEYLLAFNAQ